MKLKSLGLRYLVQLVLAFHTTCVHKVVYSTYEHFLHKRRTYMPVVIKYSPRSRGHKTMPLVRFAHSWHSFMTTRNSGIIFYDHRHNILLPA